MPKILRHKVLTLPLPNLLPVLPPRFTEAARAKRRESSSLADSSNASDRKSKGKSKGKGKSKDPVENGSDVGGALGSGSGMEVDEVGSLSVKGEDGTTTHTDTPQGRTDTIEGIPLSELPEPTEDEINSFFSSRTAAGPSGQVNGVSSASSTVPDVDSDTIAVIDHHSQTKALATQKEKDWKEPEVFYIKETGEIFLDYE
jgi:hypothetical protein